jgi:tRNA (guanine37-N1)-methyltransferase
MLIISILTIDPSRFDSFIRSHIVQRTQKLGLAKVEIVDIRDFAEGSFRDVDDSPIGGGRGLILRAEPVRKAIAAARGKSEDSGSGTQVIALTPAGKTYSQEMAHELSGKEHLILVCGHYEGMDARLAGNFDREISIGDYILTGGEIAAEAVADSVLRLLKGALREGSSEEESFENGLLEYPQYTQPADLSGEKVPEVLLSGDHARIHEYRIRESVRITGEKRPDLLKKELSRIDKKKSSGEPLTGDEKLIIETVH